MNITAAVLQILFKSNSTQVKADIRGVNQTVNKLGQEGTKSVGLLDTSLGALAATAGIVTTAIATAKKVIEFSREGAAIQRLEESGNSLAASMDSDMDEIVQSVKAASLGTISELDIISSANRAMMLGVSANADQLANLMEVAALRARAMGLSTTQAFNDIVTGIGRQSPLILDNLGIVIDSNTVYEEYAQKIGDADGVLTEYQKTQALLNQVLETGNQLIAEQGDLVVDNAAIWEQLDANFENSGNNFKKFIGEVFTPYAEMLNDILFGGLKQESFDYGVGQLGQNLSYFDDYEAYFTRLAKGIETAGLGSSDLFLEIFKKQDQLGAFNDKYGGFVSSAEITKMTEAEQKLYSLRQTFEATMTQFDGQYIDITNIDAIVAALGGLSEIDFENIKSLEGTSFEELMNGMTPFGAEVLSQYEEFGISVADINAEYAALDYTITEAEGSLASFNTRAVELRSAEMRLTAAQKDFGQSIATDIKGMLDQANLSTEDYVAALGALDGAYDTNFERANELQLAMQSAVDEYGRTHDVEAFGEAIGGLEGDFSDLSTEILDAQMEIDILQTKINNLEGKTIDIFINTIEGSGPATTNPSQSSLRNGQSGVRALPYAAGTSFTVPAGYPDDSFQWNTLLTSGEQVTVAAAGASPGGSGGSSSASKVVHNYEIHTHPPVETGLSVKEWIKMQEMMMS